MSRTAFWALALASISGCMAADSNSYRGAVVDYNFIRNYSAPRENLMANVRKFEGFIKQAKAQSADIIVFPEGALNAGDRTIFVNIPDPSHNVTPAGNNSWDEALGTLSSYANASKIYVVVNIHEGSTDPKTNRSLKYNTNVVFNRDGTVIARYRKYNLFGESYLNVTNEPELSTFQTDFGVTFGQFTCFDILFEKPALKLVKDKKIKNFVYPTWWFSELPFLTAAQAQWSWAVGNNVNLLAAGINDVPGGSSGSSIIPGRAPSWGDANFVFSNKTADTLIVANLPKDPSVVDGSFIGQPVKQTTLYRDNETFAMMSQPNIAGFQSKDIEMPSNMTAMRFTDEVCNGSFCCQFDLNITYESQNNDSISYRAVAFSGSRPFGANLGPYDVEICGVYAYNKSSPADLKTVIFGPVLRKVTFTSVKITGNFRTSNSEILPDVLLLPGKTETFLPSSKDVTFTIGDKSELVWSPNKQIVSVGIHARLFKNAASLTQMSILMVLVSSIAVFLNNKKYY